MKQKLKIIGSIILIVPALLWLYRLLTQPGPVESDKAPNTEAIKVAELELKQIEKDIESIEKKEYTDQEIMDKLGKE
jgi:hypothetical protein